MRLIILALLLLLGASEAVAAEDRFLDRADGSRIVYQIVGAEGGERRGAILVLHGSGCAPVGSETRLQDAGRVLAPGHAILTIENYGVTTADPRAEVVEGCTSAFWERNTLQQRVVDAAQVIAHLRGARWWNGRLVIFGGSEGGAVAAMLAPFLPETVAVIVFSSGIGVPVGELIRAALPPEMAIEAPRIFAEARANPTGLRRWGGASYRWWADAVDVVPANMLLQTDLPILLVHGTRDQSAPVATARATRDLLARHGRRNLTYREYQGFDHFMRDEAGNDHRRAVLAEAGSWLRRLSPSPRPPAR